uniref:Uncharacterized protein n=1 Tax=Desulfobacca acetoxidans TaxID=60893 RepID=A0A7C3SK45_9BACT
MSLISFRPFDPVIKRTEASLEDAEGGAFKVSTGTPQVILGLIEEKAKISAQTNATANAFAALVAVYGWYVAPIGWQLALFVWVYALATLLITDLIKVLGYRLLDHSGLIFSRP